MRSRTERPCAQDWQALCMNLDTCTIVLSGNGPLAARYVTLDRLCVLRKNKAETIRPDSKARAHGDSSACDGYCPSPGCDDDHPRIMGKWQTP